jgi:hypothetical protein
MLPEHKVYEHGTAVADVLIGWIYGVAGVGLLFGFSGSGRLIDASRGILVLATPVASSGAAPIS